MSRSGEPANSQPSLPDVRIPHYAAPQVTALPVTEVISSLPLPGQNKPGHYQRVVLNTRTGTLAFHENTAHLEPWNSAWRSISDVPRDIYRRWHPGTLFVHNGPHQWFQDVPELLQWTIDSGIPDLPYLDVDAANDLLGVLVPSAQALLNALFDTGGDLDWSAEAARAGRNLTRLVSRHQQAAPPEVDANLVDYGDIVRRFPQTYKPRILGQSTDDFAQECESLTRFLGSNEHWHQEIKKVFGTPYPDGSGVSLQVTGVRAWYRAALIAGDPRPARRFADWAAEHRPLDSGEITSLTTDEELDAWSTRQTELAGAKGWRLLGAREAAAAHRQRLQEQDWDRLAVVGAHLAPVKTLQAERTALIARMIGLGRSDSEIAAHAQVSRQAVNSMRQRLEAESAEQ